MLQAMTKPERYSGPVLEFVLKDKTSVISDLVANLLSTHVAGKKIGMYLKGE